MVNIIELDVKAIGESDFKFYLMKCKRHDPDLQEIIKACHQGEFKKFIIRNELLYRRRKIDGKARLVIPQNMVDTIMHAMHDHQMTAHQGVEKTFKMTRRFRFREMRKRVIEHVQNCLKCRMVKSRNYKTPMSEMQPHLITSRPFQIIQFDVCGRFHASHGNHYCLVAICQLTRYVICKAVENYDAKTVIEFLQKDIICKYCIFEAIIFDNHQQSFHSHRQRVEKFL